MIMYKLVVDMITKQPYAVLRFDGWQIPFDPANTDYQNFKKQINADEAELEDAEGTLMTDAKAFVATLP